MLKYIDLVSDKTNIPQGRTCILDGGIDNSSISSFLEMSKHLVPEWKIGWTTWLLYDEQYLREKIKLLTSNGVTIVAGGTAGEIAANRGKWREYLDLCKSLGFSRVELAGGFCKELKEPREFLEHASQVGIAVQYEVGRKNQKEDALMTTQQRIEIAKRWLEAGVDFIVIEAREIGEGYGLFSSSGELKIDFIDKLLPVVTIDKLIVEAPTRATQIAALKYIGPELRLANVSINDFFRVETLRWGIHANTYIPA